MPLNKGSTTLAVIAAGAAVAACQSAPAQYAGNGLHATYAVATEGAGAVKATGMGLYNGAGSAIRKPFHDLNLMQDKIAPVLLRAESHPYDLRGVNSCNDVLDRVSELDLALGPDVDTPKPKRRTRMARGADFAASTALDAAGTAAEHFIPMRGTIRQLSGAKRYDDHVTHAVLAGETRRSFLKAVGMSHNCTWPAAPLDFAPAKPAEVAALWNAPTAVTPGVMLAAATGRPSAAVGGASSQAPLTQVALLSRSDVVRTPVSISPLGRLALPSLRGAADPAQVWKPERSARLIDVSEPVSGSSATTTASASAAPWSGAATFAGASGRP